MKAIRFHHYGGPDLLVLDDVPAPNLCAGEVLVRIQAAGVNPADYKFRAGWFKDFVNLTLPFIPGADFSGTVERVGPGVQGFKPGDEVFGMRDVQVGGSYAQYIAVRSDAIALKPRRLSHTQAAGVPLAALTAWSALFDHAELKRGQRVLIHAASGGVGVFAVQLAKLAGTEVIATTSTDNVELVRSLGADQVIDYRIADFASTVKDIDIVLDTLGGETQVKSMEVLRTDGLIVTLQPPGIEAMLAKQLKVRTALVEVAANGKRIAKLASLLDDGVLTPIIDQVLPLAQAGQAHVRSESGRARGKIVLTVD
ncbi:MULTISPECIES: NADP-dependent oxidoreductase [unclassified Pseudomonas]|uniref:NADP-dependent oxidoreductase n=1 Tax=unclassified Pseudomonas TaxID=196821 RepID=UPI003132C7E0